MGGLALLIDPPPFPPQLALDPAWVRPIGGLLLGLLAAYLVLSALGTRMTVRGFRLEIEIRAEGGHRRGDAQRCRIAGFLLRARVYASLRPGRGFTQAAAPAVFSQS